jgi:hypothetical protein
VATPSATDDLAFLQRCKQNARNLIYAFPLLRRQCNRTPLGSSHLFLAKLHDRAGVDVLAVGEPEDQAEEQATDKHNTRPVHGRWRENSGVDVLRPEAEEDTDDAVSDGANGDRNSCLAKLERSVLDLAVRRGEALVKHDRGREQEGAVEGSNDERCQRAESSRRTNVDQGEDGRDDCREPDRVEGQLRLFVNLCDVGVAGDTTLTGKGPGHAGARYEASDGGEDHGSNDQRRHGCCASDRASRLVEDLDEWEASVGLEGSGEIAHAEQDCDGHTETERAVQDDRDGHTARNDDRCILDLFSDVRRSIDS